MIANRKQTCLFNLTDQVTRSMSQRRILIIEKGSLVNIRQLSSQFKALLLDCSYLVWKKTL